MTFQGHFVGYGNLEEMLDATKSCGHVYADCIIERSPTQTNIEYCSKIIQVSRIDGQIVHYWRWKVAMVLMIVPEQQPLDPEKAQRAHIATDSAWPAILSWLGEKTEMIRATTSMPKNMNHLEGQQPAFLDYEEKTGRYSLCEKSDA